MIIKWWYINKRVAPVRFKEFYWQTFIAPIGASLIIGLIALFWTKYIFNPLINLFIPLSDFLNQFIQMEGAPTDAVAKLAAGVVTILFAFIGLLMFTFFPLYTAFGGNDENTLSIFHEAVQISGPSRFLFLPIDKAMRWLGLKSKLHNKFPIPWQLAEKEAQDLMKEKFIKDKIVKILKKVP
jgi:hypothetical protein